MFDIYKNRIFTKYKSIVRIAYFQYDSTDVIYGYAHAQTIHHNHNFKLMNSNYDGIGAPKELNIRVSISQHIIDAKKFIPNRLILHRTRWIHNQTMQTHITLHDTMKSSLR